MPLSVPVMWNIANGEDFSEFMEYKVIQQLSNSILELETQASEEKWRRINANEYFYDLEDGETDNVQNGLGNNTLVDKLVSIVDQLGSRALLFTLLRNTPNITFGEIFEKVGPDLDNTVVYCSNAGMNCTNVTKFHAGQFSKCFDYSTSQNNTRNTVSDEGIINGLTLLLMSGVQLASVAFRQHSDLIYDHPFFQNTLLPIAADGFRLMVSTPGVQPDLDQQGIDISPGQSTLIAITGKEIIRLPWPYSECTEQDYELQLLRKIVASSSLSYTPVSVDRKSTYTQQDCRSACLQRIIWNECHCLDLQSRLPFGEGEEHLLCGAVGLEEMAMLMEPSDDQLNCFRDLNELGSAKCSFLNKLINDLACVKNAKYNFVERRNLPGYQCSCPPACHSYEYQMSLSESPWPAAGLETHSAYRKLVVNGKWKHFTNFPGNNDAVK